MAGRFIGGWTDHQKRESMTEAKAAGHKIATVRRAKTLLQVRAVKESMKEGGVWGLPEGAHTKVYGHLRHLREASEQLQSAQFIRLLR